MLGLIVDVIDELGDFIDPPDPSACGRLAGVQREAADLHQTEE